MTNKQHDNVGESLCAIPDAWKASLRETAMEQSRLQKHKADRARVLIRGAAETRRRIKGLEQKKREALYGAMADALELLCLAITSKPIRAKIRIAAREADIPETKGTPMALLVVKLCIGAEEAAASQQAQALNGALLKNIAPVDLPAHLEGEGIAKLAAHFRGERGNGSGAEKSASRRAMPKFDFSDRALNNLRKAEDKGALVIAMTASRADDGRWLVERVEINASQER